MNEDTLSRLKRKIDLLEKQLELDYEAGVTQLADNRADVHGTVGETIENLHRIEHTGRQNMATIKQQLAEMQRVLAEARLNTQHEYREHRKQIHESFQSLKATLRKFEEKEDAEALLYFKPLSEKANLLEDHLDAFHVQCALEDVQPREAFGREKERIRQALTKVRQHLRGLAELAREDLQKIGHTIRESSAVLWEWFKILNYYEEFEVDRKRKELEAQGPID